MTEVLEASPEELARRITATQRRLDRRLLVGIAGAPGAGKSWLATRLAALVPSSAVVEMDGFHRTNNELDKLGLRRRKGAPETFDAIQFVGALRTLRDHPTRDARLPSFDRTRDEPVPESILVSAAISTVIIEGNYLFLKESGFAPVRDLIDLPLLLESDTELRLTRLVQRHMHFGLSHNEAVAWMESVDEPNAVSIEQAGIGVRRLRMRI